MSLGLVASYGSSSGEESEEEEETVQQPPPQAAVPRPSLPTPRVEEHFTKSHPPVTKAAELDISDEEDFGGHPDESSSTGILDDTEPDLFSLISKKLPHAKLTTSVTTFVDVKEDLSTIPQKKDYGEKVEEPPSKKKKRDGPVRISIPTLRDLRSLEEEEEDDRPRPIVPASKTGSGLFALLPQPQNKSTRRPLDMAAPETGQERRPPNIFNIHREEESTTMSSSSSNLRPQGVRTSGLVPHVLAKQQQQPPASLPQTRKVIATTAVSSTVTTSVEDSDSDEEDLLGVNSGAYFPAPEVPKLSGPGAVNPTPGSSGYVYGIRKPPPPILPPTASSSSSSGYISLSVAEDYGPATAPYPPVAAGVVAAGSADYLVDNEEAITRLAGKAAKRKEFKEDFAVIDVHEDDMKGDPRVWLTKAMTEEVAPMPNRKGPKGLVKSRHQITYLAHQAKERDWELKQEWAQARENRRASANKYGF